MGTCSKMAFRPWRLLVAFNWGAQAVSCGPPGPPTSFSPGAAPLALLYLEAQSGRSPGVLSAGHESRGDGLVYQAAHGTWTGEERCPGPALPTQPVTRLVSEGTSGRVPISVTSTWSSSSRGAYRAFMVDTGHPGRALPPHAGQVGTVGLSWTVSIAGDGGRGSGPHGWRVLLPARCSLQVAVASVR